MFPLLVVAKSSVSSIALRGAWRGNRSRGRRRWRGAVFCVLSNVYLFYTPVSNVQPVPIRDIYGCWFRYLRFIITAWLFLHTYSCCLFLLPILVARALAERTQP